jgi:hypothetical protein
VNGRWGRWRTGRLRRRLGLGVALTVALFGMTCSSPRGSGPTPQAPGPGSVARLFSSVANNPWTTPIPPDAAVDPRSATYAKGLTRKPLVISYEQWTVPVYQADDTTPRHDVPLTAAWAPGEVLHDVPIPDDAMPDPSDDAHMVVVDRTQDCVYEFWKARRGNSGWTAAWGNAISTDSDGVYPGGLSSRASGLSAAAGLVTPEELRYGVIDHALVFAYPYTKSGGPVSPATSSDGRSSADYALPQGARVQLDPSLDLTALGLDAYELTIARALQRYGMILADTSGGFTIYAVHPRSQPPGAYKDLLPDWPWVGLEKIPRDRFRVLELGPQREITQITHPNDCARHS